jgi:hypothetical protein
MKLKSGLSGSNRAAPAICSKTFKQFLAYSSVMPIASAQAAESSLIAVIASSIAS